MHERIEVKLKKSVTIAMQNIINVDLEILGGTPVFYGTRVPIKNLFDYLLTGDSIETFLEDFDGVTKAQVMKILELSNDLIIKSIV